jgi:ATP-dependent DNA helicase RecG
VVLTDIGAQHVDSRHAPARSNPYPEILLAQTIRPALCCHGQRIQVVDIYSDRIEITNPGIPLVEPQRFLDALPQSRNEGVAALMRRFGMCEERGSGVRKAVMAVEIHQLPPHRAASGDRHVLMNQCVGN